MITLMRTDKMIVDIKLSLTKKWYNDVFLLPCNIPVIVENAIVTPIGKMANKKNMLLLIPTAANSSYQSLATIRLSKKPVSTIPICPMIIGQLILMTSFTKGFIIMV